MRSFCPDANVLIACLSPDEATDQGRSFIKKVLGEPMMLWCPAHVIAEIHNAICRKKDSKSLDASELEAIIDFFYTLPVLLLWDKDIALKTLHFKNAGIKSPYDAAYLAVAQHKEIPLITHDEEFYKKAKKLYPATLRLADIV